MISRSVLRGLMALGLFVCAGNVAWAQRPAHYFPLHQPLSPYLYYSAINTTGLPNYYTYIRPQTQFRAFLERRVSENLRGGETGGRIRLDENRVAEIVARQLEVRETTGLGATALHGTYMDYSHYFSQPATRRRN